MKHMSMRFSLLTFAVCLVVSGHSAVLAEDIEVVGCFLSLQDEAQIPARARGLLKEILVEPGDEVQELQVIASLEDKELRLALRIAEIDLNVARKQNMEAVSVEIAQAAADESAKLAQQARINQQLSAQMADSNIAERQAVAASELARDAYDRAIESREKFRASVSGRELATIQYELDKTRMDVEQARYDQSLQSLRAASESVVVEQREIAGRRLRLQISEAKLEHEVSSLVVQRMATSLDVAKEELERQQVRSPFTGIVVEKLRHAGEWVETGDSVLRVVRLDTLFAEGYVAADLVDRSIRGHEVSVTGVARGGTVTVTGNVVFVSPEIDPVNGQVLVRAEINNERLVLRPGQQVQMVIRRN